MKLNSLFKTALAVSFLIVLPVSELAAKVKFSVKKASNYTVSKVSRSQFDVGLGINFKSGAPSIAGTGKYNCEAGFKFAKQNNSLTREEINEFTDSRARKRQVKAILGSFFKVSNMKTITLQGYKGYEMTVAPRSGPDHKNVRGMMVLVETPKGRMTQVCMTTRKEFRSARSNFRSVTNNITLPE